MTEEIVEAKAAEQKTEEKVEEHKSIREDFVEECKAIKARFEKK
jgi:hypothetical protein